MLSILAIGNSFSQDATAYLHMAAEAAGVETLVVNLYIGGCSLKTHWENMQGDLRAYHYEKNGVGMGLVSLREALTERAWDVVTFQQASHDSGLKETYFPYLRELSAYAKELAPGARQHAAVCGARGANRDGHILLNGDAAHLFAVNGAVSNALAVQAKAFAYGVAPCKQRVRRQRAGGVGVHKALAAVRAALRAKLYIGHAVVADDLLGHRPSPLLF